MSFNFNYQKVFRDPEVRCGHTHWLLLNNRYGDLVFPKWMVYIYTYCLDYVNSLDHARLAAEDGNILRNVVPVSEFLEWFVGCDTTDYHQRLQEVLGRPDRGYETYRRTRFVHGLPTLSLSQYNWWEDEYLEVRNLDQNKRNYFILIVKQWVASKDNSN